jgi:hypothetical protein
MTSDFPLVGLGGPSDGIPSILPTGNTWQAPATTPTTANPFNVKGTLAQIGRAASSTGNSFLNAIFGSNFQYLTGIIGLLLIVAGIFLFRPVRDTVVNVSKTVGKAAAEGAVVA